MDYYQRKTHASQMLNVMLSKAKKMSIAGIILQIESNYGLGDKFVRSRLELMEKEGKINITGEDVSKV
jgi:DNA-binding transcriptional regulator PaaX